MKCHYDIFHNSFEGRYNLINSDTDSLVYNIQHDNIYQWIKENKIHFDLSDSVRDGLKDNENKHVIGKFKDKINNLPITEFVALNPKCYSVNHLTKDDAIKNAKKSTSVSKNVVKYQITHDKYMDTMNTNEHLSREVVSLRSKHHMIRTMKKPQKLSKQLLRHDAADKCKKCVPI